MPRGTSNFSCNKLSPELPENAAICIFPATTDYGQKASCFPRKNTIEGLPTWQNRNRREQFDIRNEGANDRGGRALLPGPGRRHGGPQARRSMRSSSSGKPNGPTSIPARCISTALFASFICKQPRSSTKSLQPYGLYRGTFDVLTALRRAGEPYLLTPKQLSTSLLLSGAGLSSRLNSLEALHLIAQLPEPDDRRTVRIQLTAGERRVNEVIPLVFEAQWARLLPLQGGKKRLRSISLPRS